jgi:hypothetical protein
VARQWVGRPVGLFMDTANAEKIFNAYRTGLLKKPAPDAGRNLDFQRLIALVILDRFPLRERIRFRRIWSVSWRGLSAAREGRLEDAGQLFARGEGELAEIGLESCGGFLGLSILESAHAYLDYREGRFERAEERTYASMDADSMLERDGTFSMLELHRIQAAHNLMRIDLRAGERLRALSLAGSILGYLEGHLAALPVHQDWHPRWLRQAPCILRRRMIAQVADEAAMALVTSREEKGWETFFAAVEPWLCASTSGIHPQTRLWIETMKARYAGDDLRYAALIGDFLVAGRNDVTALWYACITDFLDFCHTENSPLSRYVKAAILKDSAKWPSVPQAFRSCLNLYAYGAGTRRSP